MNKSEPSKRRIAKMGEARKFFEENAVLETNDCIEWPFTENKLYGYVYINRKAVYTHRLALSRRTGLPVKNRFQCLHSCHNPACFNYRHLRWGTNLDNSHDRWKDGTQQRGENVGTSKLTYNQVVTIKSTDIKASVLARQFFVSENTIRGIRNGSSWLWV